MANMVEGGKTPLLGAGELEALGFSLVIFPGGVVRALAATAREYYSNLLTSGSNEAFRHRMFDLSGLNALIGTPELLAEGRRYDEEGFRARAGGRRGETR
jgi:2-methylisocitrate lyase-like PEP mutase family enzyme